MHLHHGNRLERDARPSHVKCARNHLIITRNNRRRQEERVLQFYPAYIAGQINLVRIRRQLHPGFSFVQLFKDIPDHGPDRTYFLGLLHPGAFKIIRQKLRCQHIIIKTERPQNSSGVASVAGFRTWCIMTQNASVLFFSIKETLYINRHLRPPLEQFYTT